MLDENYPVKGGLIGTELPNEVDFNNNLHQIIARNIENEDKICASKKSIICLIINFLLIIKHVDIVSYIT